MALALGVDGGNTKTVAVVTSADGGRVGAGRAGCADIYNAPTIAAAVGEIATAARDALAAAGAEPGEIAAACFGLAGADWPEDFALLGGELRARLGLRCEPQILNDTITPIRAGTPDGVGVAIVIGTYGVCGGRNAAGDVFHIGFWPDATGARPLAQAGLDAVQRAWLGLAPATALTAPAVALFDAADPTDLLHRVTRRAVPMTVRIDAVAGLVLDAADGGDPVAVALVDDHCRILAGQARACGRGVGLDPGTFPVVLTGGLLRHPSPRMRDTILRLLDGPVAVTDPGHPAVGALQFAFDSLGLAPPPSAITAATAAADPHYDSRPRE